MSATKRSNGESHQHRQAHNGTRATRPRHVTASWIKRSGAMVGLLSACIALVVAAENLVKNSQSMVREPAGPNTSIDTDDLLTIARAPDGDDFLFQFAITLMNQGGKPDTFYRPHALLRSDLDAITYSDQDVSFVDKDGKALDFPIILQKDSPVQLKCRIKWKPAENYPGWTGKEPESADRQALTGRIELSELGKARQSIRRQFGLLAAETIRGLKPDAPHPINYLNLGEAQSAIGGVTGGSNTPGSILGLRINPVGIRPGGTVPLAAIGIWPVAATAANGHYAGRGEIASGKEVPSTNANQLAVNIRPCGGEEELVIFKAPFKKIVMGKLPCGVVMVQVEQR